MDLTKEAVEAAAATHHEKTKSLRDGNMGAWQDMPGAYRFNRMQWMRASLEAALAVMQPSAAE